MGKSRMHDVIRHLRRLSLSGNCLGLTDGQLLDSFITRKDQAAFEALLRRHGSMVFGVCQRELRNAHDAEDAFQATFLVLVRKAASIVPREMVGNWLYGVAFRTAMKTRAATAKRVVKEAAVKNMPRSEPLEENVWRDVLPVLDEELSRLPAKYRVPIVLCDLEGKSRKEASRQLGWPVGTVSTRLLRGRTMLARKLARHGLGLSVGSLAAILTQNAVSAQVPTALVTSTIKAAVLYAAGNLAAGAISANVAALTEGVLKSMLLTKLKLTLSVLFTTAVIGLGAGWVTHLQLQAAAAQQPGEVQDEDFPPPKRAQPQQPPEEPKGKGVQKTESKEKDARKDEDRIQGTWTVLCYGGPDGVSRRDEWQKHTWRFSDGGLEVANEDSSAGFTVRMKHADQQTVIGLTLLGRTWLGSYVLDGETLVISFKEPPRILASDINLVVLRRADRPAAKVGKAKEPEATEPYQSASDAHKGQESYESVNFVVTGPDRFLAQYIARVAGRLRKEKAIEWLGKELPAWAEPCAIQVKITNGSSRGSTNFAFERNKVLGQHMDLEGEINHILTVELPHEMTHVILAHYFGRPVPRWADEGAAVFSSGEDEQSRYDKAIREILNGNRRIPLRRLLEFMDYPKDVMALMAEGYSLTRFLVNVNDRKTFLAFVGQGMEEGWDKAVKRHYGYADVEQLEEAWLAKMKQTKLQGPPHNPQPSPQYAPPPGDVPRPQKKDVASPKKASDKDRLQGIWTVVSVGRAGKPAETEKMVVMVDGKRMCWQASGGSTEGGFYLDTTSNPKQFDFITSTRTFEGIYSLDGDELKLCYDLVEGAKRPSHFSDKVKGGRDKSDPVLLVLKRRKGVDISGFRLPDGSKAFPVLVEPNPAPPQPPPQVLPLPPGVKLEK